MTAIFKNCTFKDVSYGAVGGPQIQLSSVENVVLDNIDCRILSNNFIVTIPIKEETLYLPNNMQMEINYNSQTQSYPFKLSVSNNILTATNDILGSFISIPFDFAIVFVSTNSSIITAYQSGLFTINNITVGIKTEVSIVAGHTRINGVEIRATDKDLNLDNPSDNYLLVKPSQIKNMIDDAIDRIALYGSMRDQ